MKSLLDIQQDLRVLEKNIQEINECVKTINTDIETIKNSSEGVVLDYSKIELLAKQIDFGKHPLDKLKDGRACQIYLEMLLNIVRLDQDEEAVVNRMVFVQWLQIQSKIDWSLEDLYLDCLKTDKQLIYEMFEMIPKKYKEFFLVDALIVVNIAGNANEEIYQYIADIIAFLGLSTEEVKDLAFISRVSLSQNLSGASRDDLKVLQDKAKSFSHYIRNEFAEEGIKALRVVVVELPDNEALNFKWKVKQQQVVISGDVIATYQKEKRSRGFFYMKDYKSEEIKAPVSGVLFQFRDNNTNYGVIAHEKDNKDAIKSWIKARR